VLQGARVQFVPLSFEDVAVEILRLDPGAHAALDRDEDVRKRQAALVAGLGFVRDLDDFRIDEDLRGRILGAARDVAVDDEQPDGNPDLDGRQAGAVGAAIVSVMSATN